MVKIVKEINYTCAWLRTLWLNFWFPLPRKKYPSTSEIQIPVQFLIWKSTHLRIYFSFNYKTPHDYSAPRLPVQMALVSAQSLKHTFYLAFSEHESYSIKKWMPDDILKAKDPYQYVLTKGPCSGDSTACISYFVQFVPILPWNMLFNPSILWINSK